MDALFKPKQQGTANDPYMINPHGVKIQVPQDRVQDLLKKGFTLFNKAWQPKKDEPEEIVRDFPLSIAELKDKADQERNTLPVTEI